MARIVVFTSTVDNTTVVICFSSPYLNIGFPSSSLNQSMRVVWSLLGLLEVRQGRLAVEPETADMKVPLTPATLSQLPVS